MYILFTREQLFFPFKYENLDVSKNHIPLNNVHFSFDTLQDFVLHGLKSSMKPIDVAFSVQTHLIHRQCIASCVTNICALFVAGSVGRRRCGGRRVRQRRGAG